MEISRNQFFMAGLILFLLGIQFLQIESVQLKEQVATFIAERSDHPLISVSTQTRTWGPLSQAQPIASSIPRNGSAGCCFPSESWEFCTV